MPIKKPVKKTSIPTKQLMDKAKKTVKQEMKTAEKTVKNVVKSAQKFPETVKNYSVKKAKVDFKKFSKEALDILIRPRKLFESIVVNNDFDEPIIKAALYGFLGALVSTVVGFISGQGLSAVLNLIYTPIATVLLTFGFAGVLMLIAYAARGRMNFEAAVKAVSTKIFIYPVAVILAMVSVTYPLLVFTTVLVDLFVIYLAYSMVVYCLNADLKRAHFIFGAMIVAMMIFYVFSNYATAWFSLRNLEVAMQYYIQQTLGMQIDPDSLQSLMQ